MGWIGSALLIVGMRAVGKKKRWGFILGFLGEFIWCCRAYSKADWELLFICVVFLWVYAANWWDWRPGKLILLPLKKRDLK